MLNGCRYSGWSIKPVHVDTECPRGTLAKQASTAALSTRGSREVCGPGLETSFLLWAIIWGPFCEHVTEGHIWPDPVVPRNGWTGTSCQGSSLEPFVWWLPTQYPCPEKASRVSQPGHDVLVYPS